MDDAQASRDAARERLRQQNVDRALQARVARLKAHAERLQAQAARGLSPTQDAEQRRQIDDAWALHAAAVKELEESRAVYVVEPTHSVQRGDVHLDGPGQPTPELAEVRQRVGEALDSVETESPRIAVLRLHQMRGELVGEGPEVDELRERLWDVTQQVLVENPDLHFPETQWTMGSEELRHMYQAPPYVEAEMASLSREWDLHAVRSAEEEERLREESMREHPNTRGRDADR